MTCTLLGMVNKYLVWHNVCVIRKAPALKGVATTFRWCKVTRDHGTNRIIQYANKKQNILLLVLAI